MNVVAFDFETCLIQPGITAPRPVCMSYARRTDDALNLTQGLVVAEDSWPLLLQWLEDPDVILVGARTSFDLCVALVWCPQQERMAAAISLAYKQRRIRDVQIQAKIAALAEGWLSFDVDARKMPSFSLAALYRRYRGGELAKGEDTWRLRYAELLNLPVHQYPPDAIAYAVMDALATLEVFYCGQSAGQKKPGRWYNCPQADEVEQTESDWFLALMSLAGLEVDQAGAAALEESLTASLVEVHRAQLEAGILRADGTKNTGALRAMVEAAYAAQGKPAPATAKGSTSTAADTLEGSGHPLLLQIAEASSTEKLLNSFVPMLKHGIISPSYDVLKETGRTSSFGPNIQQMPTRGGVRELFRPPAGYAFITADYATIELAALAQVCLDLFQRSAMADAINAGQDLHLLTASQISGISYAEALAAYQAGEPSVKQGRKLAKVLNFGLPAGMGAEAFVEYARGFDLHISVDTVQRLKDAWFQAYPEMLDYFHHVGTLAGSAEAFEVVQHRSGRVRAGCRYTSACNTFFQGLAADGAKAAGRELARKVLLPGTALYDCLLHAFVHDEFLISASFSTVHEAAEELEATMVYAMRGFIPDVAIRVEVTASDRWSKEARRIVSGGRLQVWSPAHVSPYLL
jgi:DNA polymerase I-like protein with 3'-5' exonuclease and polymerase domains